MQDEVGTFNVLEVMQRPRDCNNYFRMDVLKEVIDTVKNQMYLKYPLDRVLVEACYNLTLEEDIKVVAVAKKIEKINLWMLN